MKIFYLLCFFMILHAVMSNCGQYTKQIDCTNNCLCTWFEDARGPDACVFRCEENGYDTHCHTDASLKCELIPVTLALLALPVVGAGLLLLSVVLCVGFWVVVVSGLWIVIFLYVVLGRAVFLGLLCSAIAIVLCSAVIFCAFMYGPMVHAAL